MVTESNFRQFLHIQLATLIPKFGIADDLQDVVDGHVESSFPDSQWAAWKHDSDLIVSGWPFQSFEANTMAQWLSIAESLLAQCKSPEVRAIDPALLVQAFKRKF